MNSWNDDHELDAELAATDDMFGDLLAHLVDPPADLHTRTGASASDALLERSALGVAIDLVNVGVETLRLLFVGDDGTSHRA